MNIREGRWSSEELTNDFVVPFSLESFVLSNEVVSSEAFEEANPESNDSDVAHGPVVDEIPEDPEVW